MGFAHFIFHFFSRKAKKKQNVLGTVPVALLGSNRTKKNKLPNNIINDYSIL